MLIWTDEKKGDLADWLLSEYGPFVPVNTIWRQLSYPSLDAARRSFSRGLAPLEAIKLPGRRGQFVRTQDLVAWLRTPGKATPAESSSDAA